MTPQIDSQTQFWLLYNFYLDFQSVFIQISTFKEVRAFVAAKIEFLSQLEVSTANRHFKSVFTPISTFCVHKAFIAAKIAFLSQVEVLSENGNFKSVCTPPVSTFTLARDIKHKASL